MQRYEGRETELKSVGRELSRETLTSRRPPALEVTIGSGCVEIRERASVKATLAIVERGVGSAICIEVSHRRDHAENNVNNSGRQGTIKHQTHSKGM